MADTKIGDLPTDVTTLAAGDKFAIADASALTVDTFCTAAEIKTFVNNAPVTAGGTASAGTWPVQSSGTLLTTAEAGAMERDANCFYLTTDAGNRGVVPIVHFIRCNATRTLPNDTNLNPIFNSPANGRLTLEIGTYLFEAMLIITAMSATSGNALINLLGAGTATANSWLWRITGLDNTTTTTIADDDSAFITTNASAASAVVAGTGTAMRLFLKGTFEISVAGTFIPSIDLVTASAGIVAIGSYFMCYRIGSDAVVSVGQWD